MKRQITTIALAIAALAIAATPFGLVYTTLSGGVAQASQRADEAAVMEVYRTSDSALDNLTWTVANLDCEEAGDQEEACEQAKAEARAEMGL